MPNDSGNFPCNHTMECNGHLPIVTAIFPPGKDIATKSAKTKLLMDNQLGPGMSDRGVQVSRSLRLMCPVC